MNFRDRDGLGGRWIKNVLVYGKSLGCLQENKCVYRDMSLI